MRNLPQFRTWFRNWFDLESDAQGLMTTPKAGVKLAPVPQGLAPLATSQLQYWKM